MCFLKSRTRCLFFSNSCVWPVFKEVIFPCKKQGPIFWEENITALPHPASSTCACERQGSYPLLATPTAGTWSQEDWPGGNEALWPEKFSHPRFNWASYSREVWRANMVKLIIKQVCLLYPEKSLKEHLKMPNFIFWKNYISKLEGGMIKTGGGLSI